MKVLHKASLDVKSGGPAMSVYYTLRGLRNLGVDAQIIMFVLDKQGLLIGDDIPIHFSPTPLDRRFCFSPKYGSTLKLSGNFDIYHIHGVWQWPTYVMASYASRINKPYIITPRGMLYPQDMKKSKWIKKFSLAIKLKSIFINAKCVHVTCLDELMYYRELGFKNPVAIIPNPIKIENFPGKKREDIFRIGYLGRLHPRKNVESLIYAFSDLGNSVKNAELLIIGGGDATYEAFLKYEVKRLGLENVRFTGFLNGDEKNKSIDSISVLAMPSEFENFGNVILEALIRKIPCIATTGSPWEELISKNCGWWVEYNQNDITNAIRDAINLSEKELKIKGENGKKMVEEKYSIEAVATKMKELYDWVLGFSQKPNFVHD